jgi:hypothetical protein
VCVCQRVVRFLQSNPAVGSAPLASFALMSFPPQKHPSIWSNNSPAATPNVQSCLADKITLRSELSRLMLNLLERAVRWKLVRGWAGRMETRPGLSSVDALSGAQVLYGLITNGNKQSQSWRGGRPHAPPTAVVCNSVSRQARYASAVTRRT